MYEVLAVADNDSEKHATEFCGTWVIPPHELGGIDYDVVVVASIFFRNIQRQLVGDLGVPVEAIDDVSLRLGAVLRAARRSLPEDYQAELLLALGSTTAEHSHIQDVSARLAESTRRLETTSLDVETWLAMRYSLMIHGFIEASEAARMHARDAALLLVSNGDGAEDPGVLLTAIRASLDGGDISAARRFRAKLSDPGSHASDLVAIDSYLEMSERGSFTPRAGTEAVDDEGDRRFRNLLAGRSVAIVGPAPCPEGLGREIDTFDVIVRVSYWGASHLPSQDAAGSRTDVSYYNEQHGARAVQDAHIGVLSDLRLAVFKDPSQVARFSPSRAAFLPGPCLFDGHPNMIPIMLFDMLHFNPSRIKVFGTNFFLSDRASRYDKSYVGISSHSASGRLFALARHDLCSQVNFVRNLVKAGAVEIDEIGARVLDMSNRDYMAAMERVDWRLPTHGSATQSGGTQG